MQLLLGDIDTGGRRPCLIYIPQLQVVNPNGAHRVELLSGMRPGFAEPAYEVVLAVDGVYRTVFRLTADQLMDHYEHAHHIVHGHDVRGLDPRDGPTRLTALR